MNKKIPWGEVKGLRSLAPRNWVLLKSTCHGSFLEESPHWGLLPLEVASKSSRVCETEMKEIEGKSGEREENQEISESKLPVFWKAMQKQERVLWKEKSYLSKDPFKNHRETNFTLKCEWWGWEACPTIQWKSYQKLVRSCQKDSEACLVIKHWASSNITKKT